MFCLNTVNEHINCNLLIKRKINNWGIIGSNVINFNFFSTDEITSKTQKIHQFMMPSFHLHKNDLFCENYSINSVILSITCIGPFPLSIFFLFCGYEKLLLINMMKSFTHTHRSLMLWEKVLDWTLSCLIRYDDGD